MTAGDEARRRVAAAGLTPAAVRVLAPVLAGVGLDRLGEVKGLLKRFFSDQPWGPAEADALAAAVGPGEGRVEEDLAPGLTLVAGWREGRFGVDVEGGPGRPPPVPAPGLDLAATFATGVVPEVTPNPRTLRFATARRGAGESRGYRRGEPGRHPGVERLFSVSPEVADVMVGPDFVAVSIGRPGRWPELLQPLLSAVAEAFGGAEADAPEADAPEPEADAPEPAAGAQRPSAAAGPVTGQALAAQGAAQGAGPGTGRARRRPGETGQKGSARPPTRFEQAWAELGHLRPDRPEDLGRVLVAAGDEEPARRQVAANLLRGAPEEEAAEQWAVLVRDRSRLVRRATMDAVVDAGRERLRPLLEAALGDADAWIRWKAVHGLAGLGVAPSAAAVEPLLADRDFRVRLEAATALRATGGCGERSHGGGDEAQR